MSYKEMLEIKEGMKVIDGNGDEIGKVKLVKYSDEDPNRPGPETATASHAPLSENVSWVDDVIRALDLDVDVPREVMERLQREGFIHIDSNRLFGSDYFATLDEIANVSDDTVKLYTTRDNIGKFK